MPTASVEAAALALQNSENENSRKRSIVAAESTEGTDSDAATRQSTTTTNASAASAFKRRKRPRPTDCDAKLALLQEENAILQSRLAALCSQNQRANQDRDEHAHQLSRLLQQQNASPDEMQKLIDHYQELYSDYGRRRHLELQWHLEQLERLANPTNVTKMGLYTLGQGPLMNGSTTGGGHGRGSNPQPDAPISRTLASKPTTNPIVGLLQKELGITGPQNKKILEQRAKIRTVCANLRECLALLNKLKELCEEKTRIFHDRLSRCREILTPEQVLKLLVWIHEHNETVSQACPGWGSEHLPVSKAL
ncbi:hypothetical protein MPSEU_000986800 [Mayamaea pseudoterrestris]|nr:hypothetical protein MPSEU_000986800 [Mayamaea pseudoterrestris]